MINNIQFIERTLFATIKSNPLDGQESKDFPIYTTFSVINYSYHCVYKKSDIKKIIVFFGKKKLLHSLR